MRKTMKILILFTMVVFATWGLLAQMSGGTSGIDNPTQIPPLDCGETRRIINNNSNQAKTYYVEVRDCCNGVDSILYRNTISDVIRYVPDQGSVCTSVTLQPNDKLYVDCNGSGNGECTVEISDTCNDCP